MSGPMSLKLAFRINYEFRTGKNSLLEKVVSEQLFSKELSVTCVVWRVFHFRNTRETEVLHKFKISSL